MRIIIGLMWFLPMPFDGTFDSAFYLTAFLPALVALLQAQMLHK